MFQHAVPLRAVPRRFPVTASVGYSSFFMFSRWNAIGNEPVTAESIAALCARMVDVIRTHTIGSYGASVNPPIGKVGITEFDNPKDKKTYFASIPSARTLQDRFKTEANIDIVSSVASYLHNVTSIPVRLAREGQEKYFAGLLRLINSALIHADYGVSDAPGWEVGRTTAQLSWNILLKEAQGGECIIYRRFWEGGKDDERFKQPNPGTGIRGRRLNFHEVNAVQSPELFPRYTVSSFIGLRPTANGGIEIILWS